MSQRIALIQPRIDTGKSLGIKKSPESIQSLAGQLEREGHEVLMLHSEESEELRQRIAKFGPQIVGISTMTPNFPEGKRIAQSIKDTREEVVIVLGGWHASGCVNAYQKGQEEESLSEILSSSSPFDYIVAGEGDLVLTEMAKRIESEESLEDIDGVGFLDGDEIRLNAAKRIKDLNVLADPSWEGLNIDEYRDQRTGNLDLSVHFNRACRFNCGFCSTSTVYGRGVTTFDPQRALNYIQKLVSANHPQVITFTDEDFFAKPQWVEALVALLEHAGLNKSFGVEFDTFASINDILRIDPALLKRMKAVGFNSFTIGIESLNSKTLRSYNKESMILAMFTPEQKNLYRTLSKDEQDKMLVDVYLECAQRAINIAQENGLLVVGDYILGNLGESEEEVKEGFDRFSQLKNLLIAYIPTFTPFPGTGLWKEAYESGKLARDADGHIDWSRFDASKGALDLGYDIASLRNSLELKFYTSERYLKDMRQMLEKRPELLPMFKGRFNYLKSTFGEDEVINDVLEELNGETV